MTIFRCPKCKAEVGSTKYIKIKAAGCSKCRTNMVRLYIPTESIYKEEHELNAKNQKV